MKICSGSCRKPLPASEFDYRAYYPFVRKAVCRTCSAYVQKYSASPQAKEAAIVKSRAWAAKNPDRREAYDAARFQRLMTGTKTTIGLLTALVMAGRVRLTARDVSTYGAAEYSMRRELIRKFLASNPDPRHCPKCDTTKSAGLFGCAVQRSISGTLHPRFQSWCTECRKKDARAKALRLTQDA